MTCKEDYIMHPLIHLCLIHLSPQRTQCEIVGVIDKHMPGHMMIQKMLN